MFGDRGAIEEELVEEMLRPRRLTVWLSSPPNKSLPRDAASEQEPLQRLGRSAGVDGWGETGDVDLVEAFEVSCRESFLIFCPHQHCHLISSSPVHIAGPRVVPLWQLWELARRVLRAIV